MTRRISSRLKEMLDAQNITQKKLSELTGITESAISHYINGTRIPRGMNLIKIANALKTTTDDLLREEGDYENELIYAKSLIARNASKMTLQEKMDFIALITNEGGNDETG